MYSTQRGARMRCIFLVRTRGSQWRRPLGAQIVSRLLQSDGQNLCLVGGVSLVCVPLQWLMAVGVVKRRRRKKEMLLELC